MPQVAVLRRAWNLGMAEVLGQQSRLVRRRILPVPCIVALLSREPLTVERVRNLAAQVRRKLAETVRRVRAVCSGADRSKLQVALATTALASCSLVRQAGYLLL